MKTGGVYIVGAGPGDPSLISVRGLRYLEPPMSSSTTDVVYQQQATALGLQLERIETLGTAPSMIAGLAELVHHAAREAGWL